MEELKFTKVNQAWLVWKQPAAILFRAISSLSLGRG